MNDPIADLLTRLRNASKARHRFVDMPHSKMKESVVKLLKEKGYVAHYLVKELKGKSTIRIFLKYDQERTPIISGLRRVSKPSLRRYVSHKEIPYVLGGIGTVVMSTSRGMMDDKKARHEKVGGEVVAYVW
ncbi:MAG: 30S ribosomal protein S8 [Chlamydiales bacterium]|nr:30S ribosomal protein S8 [Chlamydiales bacterium]MCH9635781.1 30S ribosomal protein S8 [Chlamydiales bacterium]